MEISIVLKAYEDEVVIAWLEDMPFNSFMTVENTLFAYIAHDDYTNALEVELNKRLVELGLSFTAKDLPEQNWNEEWEKNFEPVLIDDICLIRAPFHNPLEGFTYDIIINPKMAFGTGHHETTSGMIRHINSLSLADKEVLDFGSGTGILSIFSVLKGAKFVDAVDIEQASFDNMKENFELNYISNCTPFHGNHTMIPKGAMYDLILANITANVILDTMQFLVLHLVQGGKILFSGFFEENLPEINHHAEQFQLRYIDHSVQGKWVVAEFLRL